MDGLANDVLAVCLLCVHGSVTVGFVAGTFSRPRAYERSGLHECHHIHTHKREKKTKKEIRNHEACSTQTTCAAKQIRLTCCGEQLEAEEAEEDPKPSARFIFRRTLPVLKSLPRPCTEMLFHKNFRGKHYVRNSIQHSAERGVRARIFFRGKEVKATSWEKAVFGRFISRTGFGRGAFKNSPWHQEAHGLKQYIYTQPPRKHEQLCQSKPLPCRRELTPHIYLHYYIL